MMFPWLFRWCKEHHWWEVECGTPFGWQPAFRSMHRGLGPHDLPAVVALYSSHDSGYSKPHQEMIYAS